VSAYARKHLLRVPLQPVSIARARRARTAARPRVDVAAAVELYLGQLPTALSRRNRPYSPKTIQGYAYHLRVFARAEGARAVDEVGPALVASHLAELRASGHASWTITGRDEALRVWLGWLAERGILGRQRLEGVRRSGSADTPIEILSADEIAALLVACDRNTWGGTRDIAILHTLRRTGVRASELCALELEDYDGRERRLTVRHGKGNKRRVLGVPDDAAAALDDWIIVMRGREPGALFPSERGWALSQNSLNLMLRRLAGRAGIARSVHPHLFRHTFAVEFLLAGGDSAILMRLLGHTTLAMTMRYLRAVDEMRAAEQHVATMRGARRRR
jgi:site-specific recombinase XerD